MTARFKIGTRGSPLALAQANEVRRALQKCHGLTETDFEIVVIKTSGDQIQDRLLLEEGGKGLFTKEIEEKLLDGSIDFGVHSTKDMPAKLPEGLVIETFLKREDPRDVFISQTSKTVADLPEGAVVGSSSLRRQAQILNMRPDLEVVPFRGNVETRLKKVRSGEVVATLLAAAGLNRLGLSDEITTFLSVRDMLPAPGQGAIAIETRDGDTKIKEIIHKINHPETELCIRVERAVSLGLGASCRMPLGALAEMEGEKIKAKAGLFSPDGAKVWIAEVKGSKGKPEVLGKELAEELKSKADKNILEAFRIF